MKPIYLKEQKQYSMSDLKQIIDCESEKLNKIIGELMKRRILEKDNVSLKFTYVGFVYIEGEFIFVLPKFLEQQNYESYYPIIVKLLKEYNERENLTKEEVETFGDLESEENFNLFKMIHYLLQDYEENGLYTTDKLELQLNGDGEINWNQTIEYNQAYVSKGNIIYLDFFTQNIINDEENFIRKIHMFVLTQCSKIIRDLGVSEILGFPEVYFEVSADELGDQDYILDKIQIEKSKQFIDNKLILLDALYYFISEQKSFKSGDSVHLFGTRSFEIVWEKVCSYVFKNQYREFKKYIPHPVWKDFRTSKETTKDTLIPDILRKLDDYQLFFVIDAKYYTTTFNEYGTLINNAPGITDITKQYLYEKVFYKYLNIRHYGFYNIFILPTDKETEIFGEARFELFDNLGPVFLLRFNAQNLFSMYIKRHQKEDVFFKQISVVINNL